MSLDVTMAWRNVWRNPRRSVLTMCAVAFATVLLVFMLSWQFGSYSTMINSAVKIHTGHLQVQVKGYQDKRDIRMVISDPAAVGDRLEATPGVASYTSRASAFSLATSRDRTYGVLVIGIDPEGEAGLSTLPKTIRRGEYLSGGDTNSALVGRLLARNMQVDLGDELVVLGQGRDGSIAATMVKIKGIFSSGQDEFDRGAIHVPLSYFQDLYSMGGGVHEVVAVCDSLDRVAETKHAIAAGLDDLSGKGNLVVLDWRELMPGLIQAIQMDLISGLIFYVILIVVVAFSILNTFLMAIFERTREFGVMMAVGTKPGRLSRLLLMESASITLVGCLIGVILGSVVTLYFQAHGIVIPGAAELVRQFGLPERMYPRLSMLSVAIGAGLVLALTLLTAVYPAFKVRRLRPVKAMAAA